MLNAVFEPLVASCKQLDVAKSSPYTPGSIGPLTGQGEQCACRVCVHGDVLFKWTSIAAESGRHGSAAPSNSTEIWSADEIPPRAEGGCEDPRPTPE